MSLEQRILDALNEQPATRMDLVELFDLPINTVARAIRRLVMAKEVEAVTRSARVTPGTYKALVTTTSIPAAAINGVQSAKIWNPATDPKPEWLRREA